MTRPSIVSAASVMAALLAACAPAAAPDTPPAPIPATVLPVPDPSTETQPETVPPPAPPDSGPVDQPPDSGAIEGPTATPLPLPAPDGQRGVVGIVLIGPMCPVMREDEPCPDQPYQATLAFLNQRGREVARVQSDAAGRFQVELEPGTYTLRPEPGEGISFAGEQVVTVSAGQYAQVVVNYDSGIR